MTERYSFSLTTFRYIEGSIVMSTVNFLIIAPVRIIETMHDFIWWYICVEGVLTEAGAIITVPPHTIKLATNQFVFTWYVPGPGSKMYTIV